MHRVSIDRHKAELRRASNDEKLYTIAKRFSHGECVTSEWKKQSKRLIPLLPRLEYQSNTDDYYRILADHIVSKSRPILNLYPEPLEIVKTINELENEDDDEAMLSLEQSGSKRVRKKTNYKVSKVESSDSDSLDNEIRPLEDEKNILYLANGFAVNSKDVKIQSLKPSEYAKKYESEDSNSFIKILLQKYQNQQKEKENLIKETSIKV